MVAIAFTPHVQRPPLAYDPFVHKLAEALDDSLPSSSSSSPPSALQNLIDYSVGTLLSTPWPTRKDEPFRFTDTSFIKNSQIKPISRPAGFSTTPEDTQFPNLDIIDGFVVNLSNLGKISFNQFAITLEQTI
ncbi:hypothetical protein M0R45_008473 [Rubus argutus]|uniref:Uncharacterized protein n=1 Tax=Rubus argutus TaxID=59490 RepID=A0AAW1Y460_RUBAR